MKKIKRFILLSGMALSLCSCNKETALVNATQIPNHITKTLSTHLNINADIIIPDEIQSEVEILEIERKKMNAKALINILSPDAVATSIDQGIYKTDETLISISDGNYFYEHKNSTIYSRFFTEQESLRFPNTVNLKELDYKEALEKSTNYLSLIGLNDIELDEYYVLNKTFLENQYNENKKKTNWKKDLTAGLEIKKEDWATEKGAYIFHFSVIENNLPIAQSTYFAQDGSYITGTSIDVCYYEGGIAFVNAVSNYTVKSVSGVKQFANIEHILNAVNQKFTSSEFLNPITIKEIRLVYQAQKIKDTLYFMPVWAVQYSEQCQDGVYEDTLYFDIETSKEAIN